MKNSSKKRVLVVSQHFWPETFRVTDMCEGFIENGYEVDVLCGIPNYPSGNFFEGYGLFRNRSQVYKGINIIRVPEIPRGNNTNFRILLNYISFPFFALFYIPKLMVRKYDRILVYQLSPVFMALPGIVLSKINRKKLFIYICDFWPHSLFSILKFENKYILNLITKLSYWHYRQADGLMGVFKGIQTRLISDVGIPKSKTLYIAQSAEKIYERDMHDPAIKKRFKGKFNIVFAGSINPAQSFETVIEAAKILITKNGYHNIRFIIVGDGMSRSWLMREVGSSKLKDYFVFEGFKPYEEVPKYQTIADALLVALSESQLFEYGIPAKVQSYMASGKPIVGAMNGEGQRLINETGCGICVDSGDAQGLSDATIKLLESTPEQRLLMGKKGKDYHFKHFERDYNIKRVVEFIFHDNRIVDREYPD